MSFYCLVKCGIRTRVMINIGFVTQAQMLSLLSWTHEWNISVEYGL